MVQVTYKMYILEKNNVDYSVENCVEEGFVIIRFVHHYFGFSFSGHIVGLQFLIMCGMMLFGYEWNDAIYFLVEVT